MRTFAFCLLAVSHAEAGCTSVADCSLNGNCDQGTCKCDAGWKGDQCSVLSLVPADSLRGNYQFEVSDVKNPDNTSTWGSLPLKGPDGRYHLFASQFVQNCTLANWNPSSTVVRAVGDDPFGPFVYAETVFGTFHHNPTVRLLTPEQSGTGKPLYVMCMIGADRSAPVGSGRSCEDTNGDPHQLEGFVTMAWAESLLGPWTKSQHALLTSGDLNRWDALVTNPAPLFPFANETAYLFFRGTQWPVNGEERIGLSKAPSWKGPYARVSEDPIWTGRGNDSKTFVEDPFIWMDHKGRGIKGLFHGHFDEHGYYGFAETVEGPWIFRDQPAYTNVISMADGTSQMLVQRERPQLWFDEKTGEPSILFTGVAPPGADFYGYTYSFAQRIHTAAAVEVHV